MILALVEVDIHAYVRPIVNETHASLSLTLGQKTDNTAFDDGNARPQIHQNDIWYTLNQSKRVDVLRWVCPNVRCECEGGIRAAITSTRQMEMILSADCGEYVFSTILSLISQFYCSHFSSRKENLVICFSHFVSLKYHRFSIQNY